MVTLSPDGTRIAASAGRSQVPLVCVWETATGRLSHWITDAVLDHPAFALSFSSNARELADSRRLNRGGALGPEQAARARWMHPR